MEIKLYSKDGILKLTSVAEDNSRKISGIQEESILSLSFKAFTYVPVEVYDYIDYLGERFWALSRYVPQMDAEEEWSYSFQLYGISSLSKQLLMVNTFDGTADPLIILTAPAREHAALIVANLNRAMNTTEWKVGEVVVSEYIDIDYTGKYISDALSELATATNTEWWFDGKTLNICRCEFGEAISLSYGNGLLGGIRREIAEGVKFFTRLYPVGSSRNIHADSYGHSQLQLPGGVKYVEQDTELGIVEHFEQTAFEDIYPRRIGKVGTVRHKEMTDEDGKPFTVWYFTDPDIPFDPNQYEIGGLVKRVTFQTGELRGREFEVNYDSKKKEFEIITQWPYDNDMQLPSQPLVPTKDDEYVLWNIRMPETYYTEAEEEFRKAVDDFMAENRKDLSVYIVSTDYITINQRGIILKPGQRVRFESEVYFPGVGYCDTRVVHAEYNVDTPGRATLRLSDVLSTGRINRIEQNIQQVERLTREVSSEFPDIIKSWEETPASDATLYSSRKSEREFLNKRRGGTVEGITRFLKRQQLDEGFRTSDFASGITGFGAQIDGRGAGELESLFIRRFLEVPELRYNRVGISVGDDWSAPGAGVIESVDKDQKLVTLKLEEGEIGAVAVGDICMGIFHDFDPSNNATADSDDGQGNRTFAGFATVYFRITEVLVGDRNEQFRYELRPLSATFTKQLDPMESMTFVAYGSFTNPARRSSRYSTRTYQRYLRNVSDWEFTAGNIAAQFGDLTNLSVFGIQMSGYSAYLDNIYLQGMISSLDKKALFDTQTKLFRMVGDSGTGVAFTPEEGWKQGKLYDPATGQFQKEFDIEQIDQTAKEAKDEISNLQFGARNYIAKVYISDWNNNSQGKTDIVISGSDADGSYQSVDYKAVQEIIAGTGATNADIFRGKIKFKAGMQYNFKVRWKLLYQMPAANRGMYFMFIYTDNTTDVVPIYGNQTSVIETTYQTKAGKTLDRISASYSYFDAEGKTNRALIYDIQLTEGNKAPTGYIMAEEDVQAQIEQAEEAIDAVKQTADDANIGVSSLKNFTDEAFSDGVISRAEASAIEKYTNSVDETKKSVDASYATVYGNLLLSGTAKSNLQAAKSTFDTVVADLLASIHTASADGIATPEEKADVDSKYAQFNDAYSTFCTRLEEANKYIQTAINTTAQGAYQLSQEIQSVVNNINETILPDLQDQIDKSIISWGGDDIPTLNNYPANEWTTDTERKRHINDSYDRKVITNGEVSYESYKFVFENGVYQWNRIADSGSATAIAEARKALGLAGTKARVFYGSATPSAPYEVNDVWFRTSGSGDSLATILYISNADKGDGETATENDWQLVDDSQVRLRQMSSDNVISREEKASLRNTLVQMQKEFAAYQSDANTYGISITALATAYNQLVNFLTGTIAVNNDTDTTLTESQRTDYNTRFASYTSEASRFSNLIADAIAQGKVNNLQFGARNYIAKVYLSDWNNNSQGKTDIVLTGSDTDGSYQSVNYRAVQEIISSGDSTRADIFRGKIKFKAGMQYNFKVRWKLLYEMSASTRGMYFVFIYTDKSMDYVPIYGNQTSVIESTYLSRAGKTLDRISASYSNFDAEGKTNRALIYDIQLTEGNKAPTGYLMAEEDIEGHIEQVKKELDYIASDSSFTPSEKQQVTNEWTRIQNEYWSLMARAQEYKVSTDTLTNYFQILENYITPLLSDMSTTSKIIGAEFRKVFSDYYDVSSAVMDLVNEAEVDNIKSGYEYLTRAMEDGSTEVKGGVVMTSVSLMKNAKGEVTAGVSGLQEDGVPFWAGADYLNRKKAIFRVYSEGDIHAAKGTIGIMQVKNDAVEVSNAEGSGNKIILSIADIKSVSQVIDASGIPGDRTTEGVSVITTSSASYVSDYKPSAQFRCGAGVEMSGQITGSIRATNGAGGSVKVELVNQTTSTTEVIYRQSTADAGSGSVQINKKVTYRFTNPADQSFYVRVTAEASSSGALGSSASATADALTFSFKQDVRKNLIAPNGIAVVQGSSNYMVSTGNIFEVIQGQGGLKIENGYIWKKDVEHPTWTKI